MVIKRLHRLIAASGIALATGCSGCGVAHKEAELPADLLVQIGDSGLTMSEVALRLPPGLSDADSAALVRSIVDSWIEDMLIAEIGRNNIDDMERIDRLTQRYRNSLIITEYLRKMRDNGVKGVPEDSIRSYYSRHSAEMLLERPIVKGVYIKLPSDADGLDDIRRWMRGAQDMDIDHIESNGLRQALQYEFFRDRWVDWQTIKDQIPYQFYDADAFLKQTRDFETEYSGNVYLLHVYDYLPSGTEMPYEFAKVQISEILGAKMSARMERKIVNALIKKAMDDNRLRAFGYDPLPPGD